MRDIKDSLLRRTESSKATPTETVSTRTLSGTQQQSLADITLSNAHVQETALLDQPAVTSKVCTNNL